MNSLFSWGVLGDDNRNKNSWHANNCSCRIYGKQTQTIDGRRFPSVDGYSYRQSQKQKQNKRTNQNSRSHQARATHQYEQEIFRQDCRDDPTRDSKVNICSGVISVDRVATCFHDRFFLRWTYTARCRMENNNNDNLTHRTSVPPFACRSIVSCCHALLGYDRTYDARLPTLPSKVSTRTQSTLLSLATPCSSTGEALRAVAPVSSPTESFG